MNRLAAHLLRHSRHCPPPAAHRPVIGCRPRTSGQHQGAALQVQAAHTGEEMQRWLGESARPAGGSGTAAWAPANRAPGEDQVFPNTAQDAAFSPGLLQTRPGTPAAFHRRGRGPGATLLLASHQQSTPQRLTFASLRQFWRRRDRWWRIVDDFAAIFVPTQSVLWLCFFCNRSFLLFS